MLLLLTPASAGDHLVPVESASEAAAWKDDYASIIRTVFKLAFQSAVRARVYITAAGPGPTISDMIFLQEEKSRYSIVCLHTDSPLWMYRAPLKESNRKMHFPLTPADYRDIKPASQQSAVPASIGKRIVSAWEKSLLDTRFELKQNRGQDGGDFLFSMEVKYADFDSHLELAGTTWSPQEDQPKLSALADIVDSMEAVCATSDEKAMNDLDAKLAVFETKTK
jgi:hypothetical protein